MLDGEAGVLTDGGPVGPFCAGGETVFNEASSRWRKTEVGIVTCGLCKSAA